jgi:hypothetical protein
MKKIFLTITVIILASCSNMSSDAQKVCELLSETKEIMPEMMKIGMKSAFGDEDATKKLEELKSNSDEIGRQVEAISSKYDEDEFQVYLLENCEVAKELKEFGEALEGIGDGLE